MGFSPLFLLFGMGVELEKVRQIVEEVVQSEGYDPVEVELKGAGRHRVLRVFIDQDGGISHGDCERISEQVGTVLDVENLIPFSYTLEVSSPGLDRKLIRNDDYKRFEGCFATIRTKSPLENQKVFKGLIKGLHGDSVQVEIGKGKLLNIPLDVIKEARLEVDWAAEMARK